MFQFRMLDRIDQKLRERVERVAETAMQFGDRGVAQWADRAACDALMLGRLRERDVKALERLENTYNGNFYRNNGGRVIGNPIHA